MEYPSSQQFSHLINLVRQNQQSSPVSAFGPEAQVVDGDTSSRVLQPTSLRTTPNGSRRWWRPMSDNESEGFDNLDSVFGESESIARFGGYGAFHGEGDVVSYSVYGGESDVSVDVHSFLDGEVFIQPHDRSDFGGDTDIDQMHAGLDRWNSQDQDEEDEDWGESNAEDRIEGTVYVENPDDYLDAVGFEVLLEQLAKADDTRRGAPPAAASFVDNLPCVIIDETHMKHATPIVSLVGIVLVFCFCNHLANTLGTIGQCGIQLQGQQHVRMSPGNLRNGQGETGTGDGGPSEWNLFSFELVWF
ncbi:hypothetical protein IFM89_034966 [Coptis chinensis]|uniref:Uncharacterized protein n=1 Tax=Coptis chinensis TaxID=261450 RepID=A0A835LXD1_9MAGN|nr:hypothetical protein IFM89_034966 [Coptis chinensis]